MNRIKRALDFRSTRPGIQMMKADSFSKETKEVNGCLIEVCTKFPKQIPEPREIELLNRTGVAHRFAVVT